LSGAWMRNLGVKKHETCQPRGSRCEPAHTVGRNSFRQFSWSDRKPTYRDVGSAGLVGNIAQPTYRDVGSAGLVGNIAQPTYRDVGSAGLVGKAREIEHRHGHFYRR